MNGLSCVKGEIHNVLAVLRVTGRNTSTSIFSTSSNLNNTIEKTRHKLITSFKELHLLLCLQEKDLYSIDTRILLRPFCDLICSSDIGGIDIMNITLTSIHKFLLYNLLNNTQSLFIFEAINNTLIPSIFNISFFDNSTSDRELIHIRLQEIILELLRNSCGYLLTNDNICLCVSKCFEMRLFHRNYNKTNNCLMVRYTENVIIQMILLIFNKIKQFDSNNKSDKCQGFDIKAMETIFKYLTKIINPNTISASQDFREFGLRLINVALETSGQYLNNYSTLIKIIQNDLCRQLLINSQSHNFIILSLTLRIIFDLFNYVKEQIRVQLEVFFISIHLRIAESNSSSFEQKELILESIVEFCREPDLIIGLYTNYDCQVGSTHLFEDLCNFLLNKATIHYNNDTNTTTSINNLHLIAAEGILAIIDCIARKFIDSDNNYRHTENKEEYEQIMREQQRKKLLKLSAKLFNQKLSKSFQSLQEIQTLKTPLTCKDVAEFLLKNPYLDKVKIGEFLGKNKEFNIAVLKAYINTFNFNNMSPDKAIRIFLEKCVLHGDNQDISRVLELFSSKLFNDRNKEISPLKSEDSAFTLAYSMIILNTDAHKSQIKAKNKMTFDAYKNMLKGTNKLKGEKESGESFPDKFLEDIYNSIANCEIKVRSHGFDDIFSNGNGINNYNYDYYSDENDSGYNSDDSISVSSKSSYSSNVKTVNRSQWLDILKQSLKLPKFSTIAPLNNGKEMFNILWEPALSILQFHLRYAGHPKVLDRVVQGIQTLARIAHFYQISSAFNAIMQMLCNHLILCLLQFGIENELLPTTFHSRIYNSDNTKNINANDSLRSIYNSDTGQSDIEYENQQIPYFVSTKKQSEIIEVESTNVDDTLHILAIDIRITYTIKVFFDLIKEYGGLLLTDGWASVMKVLLWLFHLDLIPYSEFEMEDFTNNQNKPLPSLSDPILNNITTNNQIENNNTITSSISNAFWSMFTVQNEYDEIQQPSQSHNVLQQGTVDEKQFIEAENGNDNIVMNDNELGQVIPPKCQNIVNSIIECKISDIFTLSKTYTSKSFLNFIRTLISLSNTECNNTIAAKSFFEIQDNIEEKKEDINNQITPSATTHMITSTDNVPIQTSKLMNTNSKNNNNNNIKEDVICLPLTIDMKIFCLERLSQIMSVNMARINEIWILITEHFKSLVRAQQNIALKYLNTNNKKSNDTIRHSNYFFERITVNILKLCVELFESQQLENESEYVKCISIFLNLFSKLDDSILFIVGRRIIAGIKLLLNIQLENENINQNNRQCFKEENDWKIILNLMKKFSNCFINNKQLCLDAFHLIELISQKHLTIINFNFVLTVLITFGKYNLEAPIHNTRVIECILSIYQRLIIISNNNEIVLGQMWFQTLKNIASFCYNNDYNTRRFAINALNKSLLQYPIFKINIKNIDQYKLLFGYVLLPLLSQLTEIENKSLKLKNIKREEDLRLKLLTLIFQLFLHDIQVFVQYDTNFNQLWYEFLNKIKQFMKMCIGQHELLMHCKELLKNVILVFQTNKSGNIFDILSNKTNTNVWDETWNILNDVASDLKEQLDVEQ